MSWQELLPKFALRRRITVVVLMVTALVVGAVSAYRLPLELIPSGFEAPTLTITASWRDAPPREVLDKLAIPLEEELSTVRGLEHINSWSETGRVQVYMTLKQGVDMDVAYREVRDRVLRARTRMPSDIDPIRILKLDATDVPVMVIGVAIDPSVTDSYNLIEREIIRPLSRVDGVASARSPGLSEKEVLIEIDRAKTRAAGLNIFSVAEKLSRDNFALASGHVKTGGQKLQLRSQARLPDPQAIANQLVAPSIRVGDIGEVRYAEPQKLWRIRFNSKPALAVEIYKEGPANTMEVGRRLEQAFDEIAENPKLGGSELAVIFTQSTVIDESLGTLLDSGKIGALLAALVLFFFLRRVRTTLVIVLAIPLSLVLALTAMYFAGESLNILSLLGLIISVGLLVDNSVVVAENIIRHHREGKSPHQACVDGASEITLAVILATLTSVAVFLPVALVEGRAQFFLLRLALPLVVSLAASLFVALLLIPLFIRVTLTADGDNRPRRGESLHRLVDRTIGGLYAITLDPLGRIYSRILGFFLRRRFDLVLTVLMIFVITLSGPAASLEIVDVSSEDRQDFRINVDLPDNYSLDDAEGYFLEAEAVLEEIRVDLDLQGCFTFHTANFGRVQGWFDASDFDRQEVTDYVLERLPKKPGIELFSGEQSRTEKDQDRSEHAVVIHGEDPDILDRFALEIEKRTRTVPGVIGIQRATEMLTPNEVALRVDRGRANRVGLSPELIAGAVAVGLRGRPLRYLHWEDKVVPVRIRLREEDRRSLDELSDFSLPSQQAVAGANRALDLDAQSEEVSLGALTRIEHLTSERGIFRQDKRTAKQITFDIDESRSEEVKREIERRVTAMELPEGVRQGEATSERAIDAEKESLKFAALISVLFVYLLMGFLFESFVLPISILVTIPLASLGVLWTHYWAGRDLDFLGFIGVILLIGVVVNNGIVLIDYVTRLRAEGLARAEAIVLAARRRFRPIMMTAGSTIVGMIPLTVGAPTSIGLSYQSFGLALIGGMVTATALTLLVVPVFYSLIDDARIAVLRAVAGRKGARS